MPDDPKEGGTDDVGLQRGLACSVYRPLCGMWETATAWASKELAGDASVGVGQRLRQGAAAGDAPERLLVPAFASWWRGAGHRRRWQVAELARRVMRAWRTEAIRRPAFEVPVTVLTGFLGSGQLSCCCIIKNRVCACFCEI